MRQTPQVCCGKTEPLSRSNALTSTSHVSHSLAGMLVPVSETETNFVMQLANSAVVSGSGSLYGVLHVCAHGVLFPRTKWISSARYHLDDPSRKKAPIGAMQTSAVERRSDSADEQMQWWINGGPMCNGRPAGRWPVELLKCWAQTSTKILDCFIK